MHQPNCNCFFNLIASPADPEAAGDHKFRPELHFGGRLDVPDQQPHADRGAGLGADSQTERHAHRGDGAEADGYRDHRAVARVHYGAVARTRHLPRQQYQERSRSPT